MMDVTLAKSLSIINVRFQQDDAERPDLKRTEDQRNVYFNKPEIRVVLPGGDSSRLLYSAR
jgi:hypothetical protein